MNSADLTVMLSRYIYRLSAPRTGTSTTSWRGEEFLFTKKRSRVCVKSHHVITVSSSWSSLNPWPPRLCFRAANRWYYLSEKLTAINPTIRYMRISSNTILYKVVWYLLLYSVFHNECPNFKPLYFCNHEMNETCTTWTAVAWSFIRLPLDSTTSAQTNATVSYGEYGIDGLDARDPKTWHYTLGPQDPQTWHHVTFSYGDM